MAGSFGPAGQFVCTHVRMRHSDETEERSCCSNDWLMNGRETMGCERRWTVCVEENKKQFT
jgi:hypothetical protein